jgi:hypothetical protein
VSKADELREKAARLKEKTAAGTDANAATDHPVLAAVPTVRARPIRNTVDLSPHQHASLKAWCGEPAVSIGSSRVTGQDVLRALVARLLTDETLARKIRDDLRADQ